MGCGGSGAVIQPACSTQPATSSLRRLTHYQTFPVFPSRKKKPPVQTGGTRGDPKPRRRSGRRARLLC